jgi:hypothetical protein
MQLIGILSPRAANLFAVPLPLSAAALAHEHTLQQINHAAAMVTTPVIQANSPTQPFGCLPECH